MQGRDMKPDHLMGQISARLTMAGVCLEGAANMAADADPNSRLARNLKAILENYSRSIKPGWEGLKE